jgi:TrmH family RNA methyltransferase
MQAISKNQIKYIRSLAQIKFRKECQCYVVEGVKNAEEWLVQKADVQFIVATEAWLNEHTNLLADYSTEKILSATDIDFEKISGFKTPNQVLLVVHMPANEQAEAVPKNDWLLVLDRVQDPGNLGTIIRTADWFGIKHIYCSPETVEQYNPKVIQSTMGSLLRVTCHYTDLNALLQNNTAIPSYAAVLGGAALEKTNKYEPGFIIMGNESKGISPEIQKLVQHKLTIPQMGNAESLNVGVAAGIFCFALIQ